MLRKTFGRFLYVSKKLYSNSAASVGVSAENQSIITEKCLPTNDVVKFDQQQPRSTDNSFTVDNNVKESKSKLPSPSEDPYFSVDSKPKKSRSPSTPRVFSTIANSLSETAILDYYNGNLSKRDGTVFCLFNPGVSGSLPEKFLEAGAKRVLILDANKAACDHWRTFKTKTDRIIGVEQIDFSALCNISVSDGRREKANRFVEILKRYNIVERNISSISGKNETTANSPVTFIGALPFFKERGFFVELVRSRAQATNLFEFGSVDFLLYISASKYLILCQESESKQIHHSAKYRRNFYNLMFDIQLINQAPLNCFSPKFSLKTKVPYKRNLDKALLSTDDAYLVHIRPKLSEEIIVNPRFENVYLHFEYFNRQLLMGSKTVQEFMRNVFPGSEDYLTNSRIAFMTSKCKTLTLDEEVRLFNALTEWSGYKSSHFCKEAEKHVDKIVLSIPYDRESEEDFL